MVRLHKRDHSLNESIIRWLKSGEYIFQADIRLVKALNVGRAHQDKDLAEVWVLDWIWNLVIVGSCSRAKQKPRNHVAVGVEESHVPFPLAHKIRSN